MSTLTDIPFQQLLDALRDDETPLQARFLYRLSDLEQSDLDQLARVWPQVSVRRRRALMEDVEDLGEKNTLLSYKSLGRFATRDEDPKVRVLAVRTLWEYEDTKLASMFLELLKTDPDPEVRAAAAGALGRFVYAAELDLVSTPLHREIEGTLLDICRSSEDPSVRRMALEALGFTNREEVASLIETAFASGERAWVVSALFAMGRSANRRWRSQVLEMLHSILPDVRAEAARAAGELTITDAVPILIDLLDDPDENIRFNSIWSLSEIGSEGVRDVLEGLYDEIDSPDELDLLEAALDNLSFAEGIQMMPLLDLPEQDDIEDSLIEDNYYALGEDEEPAD